MQVIEKSQTVSGAWQVRVAITPDTAAFFKFDHEPSEAEIQRQAEIYALQRQLNELTAAPLPQVEPEKVRLTKLAYMNRFTDAELVGIYGAAKQYPAVEVWLEKFKLAEFVDTSDPAVLAGLTALEQAGLLAQGRAAEIVG